MCGALAVTKREKRGGGDRGGEEESVGERGREEERRKEREEGGGRRDQVEEWSLSVGCVVSCSVQVVTGNASVTYCT